MSIPLKPIIYTNSALRNTRPQNKTEQIFLLKALQVTQDPKELQKLLGVRTVARVYQTMDKLAMRKEYHSALERNGIDFDFIVRGIKGVAIEGFKDADKLNAYKILLKSVGMENYGDEETGSKGNWEDVLLKKIEEGGEAPVEDDKTGLYEVNVPQIPESVKKMREEEKETLSTIYDIPDKS
jgi:hypothetical protein